MFRLIKSLFPEKPPVEFRHAEFGLLTMTSGMWNGQMERNGRTVHFCVSGTDTKPDAVLLERVRHVLSGGDNVEKKAVAFLRAQDPSVQSGDFIFRAVDFPWQDKPDVCVMEFRLANEDEAIWRVDVEGGEPKCVWPR